VIDAAGAPDYIGRHPEAAALTASVRDVILLAEGKLNDVFLIRSSSGSLVLKRGLPWVHIYPDWPLPAERTRHEARVYQIVGPLVCALISVSRYVVERILMPLQMSSTSFEPVDPALAQLRAVR
jgi:5-methylthioribose kinase